MTVSIKRSLLPNKYDLIQNIQLNFPQSVLEEEIWLAYTFTLNKNGTYSKPPLAQRGHTVDPDKKGVSFYEACKDGYPGIKINPQTSYIAFDIDDKEAKLKKKEFDPDELSSEFMAFIQKHQSYTEISPSQCGLRVFFRCKDKTGLPGRKNLNPSLCIGGELFINSGYVTVTGDKLFGEDIKEIQAKDLTRWYSFDKTQKDGQPHLVAVPDMTTPQLPTLQQVTDALRSCKLDQSDKIKDAYRAIMKESYSHYDYWLKLLAACHDYGVKTGQLGIVFSLALEWSQTDAIAFESEDDVITKWQSFEYKPLGITYQTLFKFHKLLRFQWPEEQYEKGQPTGKPMINSFKNFKYLMNHLDISLQRDIYNNSLYIKCPQNIAKEIAETNSVQKEMLGYVGPYNLKTMKSELSILAQQNGYQNIAFPTLNGLSKMYMDRKYETFNIMELWLNTESKDLPKSMLEPDTDIEKSNLEYLMSCITFGSDTDMTVTKAFFETFFFEMMMPVYNTNRDFAQRSFMFVLTGPEACRKTTFFTLLFPKNLRDTFVTNSVETLNSDKSVRDLRASLVSSALVVIDEMEIFYNKKNDSLFKTIVTADTIEYVPIYETEVTKAPRTAVLAGTTNKDTFAFEQNSNRRLAIIKVKWIDTSAMLKINWHHFYRDYVRRGKEAIQAGKMPWKVPQSIIDTQYQKNEKFRARTDLELVLCEIFDFEMLTHEHHVPYDTAQGMKNPFYHRLKDIRGILLNYDSRLFYKISALKHTLKRLCGNYTKTADKKVMLKHSIAAIENGIVQQSDRIYYVMPPKRTDFD